jgi:hypothetical protein
MGFKEIDIANKLARRSDPATSHAAAYRIVKSGQLDGECKQVYDALKRFTQTEPCTPRELAVKSELDYIMISKRLSVLEKKGYAVRRGERLCTVSKTGLMATQWEAI